MHRTSAECSASLAKTSKIQNPSLRSDPTTFAGVLPDDEVHVWFTPFSTTQYRIDSLCQLLAREELDRAGQFKVTAARDQFVIAHAFLRLALARYLHVEPHDLRFQTTEHGKPEVAGESGIKFNLSHTDGAAVVAITRNRTVGVDVEKVRPNREMLEVAKRFFAPRELAWLQSQPASEWAHSFFACWTAKEAYIKALGTGFATPLREFSVIPRAPRETVHLAISGSLQASDFTIWPLELGADFQGAVAVQGENMRLRPQEGPDLWYCNSSAEPLQHTLNFRTQI